MANVSTQFMDDMGPLAAMWTGRNQGQQENTTQVNQQIGLESIANSQQTRDIQKQKLPFELSELQHKQEMQPLLKQEKETSNAAATQKLDRDKFNAFFDDFRTAIPQLQGTPADGAVLSEVAKKHGMDPNDPRIGRMIQTAASGNAKAVNEMLEKIALSMPVHQQAMAKERFSQGQQTGRTLVEQEGMNARTAATIAGANERARIAAAAKAEAAKAKNDLLAKGIDPVKAKTALIIMGNRALQAGDVDQANAFFEQANDPALSALVTNAQAQRAQTVLTPGGEVATQGGTVPVPQAGPPAPASGPKSMPPGHEKPQGPAPQGRSYVKDKNGTWHTVPTSQVEAAKKQGYTTE